MNMDRSKNLKKKKMLCNHAHPTLTLGYLIWPINKFCQGVHDIVTTKCVELGIEKVKFPLRFGDG